MSGRSVITGVGHFLPPRVVTNADLPSTMNVDSEGIVKRTGVEQRHWVEGKVYTSDLAAEAGRAAIADAGLEPDQIDCLVAATLSPDYSFPGLGVYTQTKLGIAPVPAYDVRNQCSGFLYSLNVARAFVESGTHQNVLVVGAELHSHALGMTEKHAHISPLFGDGAGAVVLSAGGDSERDHLELTVDYLKVFADGKGADRLRQRVWDISLAPFMDWSQIAESPDELWYAEMDGQYIFRRAVTYMAKAAKDAVKEAGLSLDDIAWVIPHQANLNINKTVGSILGLAEEKMLSNIQRVGNTTAASIPILLSESVRGGRISSGDRVLLLAFGSGLTWGAAILTAQ